VESIKTWSFYRYSLTEEYYDKPTLAPPLIVISLLWRVVVYAGDKCRLRCMKQETRDKSQCMLASCLLLYAFVIAVQYNIHCVSKNCIPKAGRHKFCYFPNTEKIQNIRFVVNFILNKSCEFYYDDVTMTSFIGNK